ncbi:36980_t:CDS:2, partial [Racocetra persica]
MRGLVDNKEKELHRNVRKDQFSVLLLSATYLKLPTSIQLSSKYVKDYCLNNFTKMADLKDEKDPSKPRHPNLFKRKLLIFVDKPEKDENGVPIVWKKPKKGETGKKFDKIDVELLEKDTKVIIANNALRPYITDIIKTLEPPLIFVLSSAYEMGFSFGD